MPWGVRDGEGFQLFGNGRLKLEEEEEEDNEEKEVGAQSHYSNLPSEMRCRLVPIYYA